MDDVLKQAQAHVLERYGSRGYDFWRESIEKDPISLAHPNDPNLEIEIAAIWDRVKPGGAIRVLVSTFELRPRRFRFKVPTVSFLVFEDGRIDSVPSTS